MFGSIITNVSTCVTTSSVSSRVALSSCGVHKTVRLGSYWGNSMYSNSQFVGFEIMCHQRATLAKKKMECWQAETEYWLAEAEEWKQFRESRHPFKEIECLA
jgi:hypothetical protein